MPLADRFEFKWTGSSLSEPPRVLLDRLEPTPGRSAPRILHRYGTKSGSALASLGALWALLLEIWDLYLPDFLLLSTLLAVAVVVVDFVEAVFVAGFDFDDFLSRFDGFGSDASGLLATLSRSRSREGLLEPPRLT